MVAYIIREDTNYRDFHSGKRCDCGIFTVEEEYFLSIKDMLEHFSNCCADYVKEYVYLDRQEAEEIAMKKNNK